MNNHDTKDMNLVVAMMILSTFVMVFSLSSTSSVTLNCESPVNVLEYNAHVGDVKIDISSYRSKCTKVTK